jgi:dinuclear metal center YbgI/SA1388 family protein
MAATSPTLAEVVDVLHEIAPLELAATWDNVGLLLEPKQRRGRIARVLLAIDLTGPVADEAARTRADLLVAYHPPIFEPVRRLAADDPRQRALLAVLQQGLAVYAPHTALDAAPGGIADWLAEGVCGGRAPVSLRPCGDGDFGRWLELPAPVQFASLLPRIKRHLGVRSLRVARPAAGAPARVRTVALAAGAGGSVLRGERADLWLTGELSHHDALAAVAAGTTVVVGEHSNTERGYLPVLAQRLRRQFGQGLEVRIAHADRDPFAVR